MKYALGLLSLAFLLPSAAALADDATPPPPPPGASAPAAAGHRGFSDMRRDMRQNRAQFEKIMLQARSQMLGALTSQHRALLANLVGQLAIAPKPDPEAAAKRLDAALSPSESKAVLAAAENAHTQMRTLMGDGMREHHFGPDGGRGPGGMNGPGRPEAMGSPGPGGPGNGPPMQRHEHHMTRDAGRILLHLASFGPPGPEPR
jgi:hypothetical protein